jgi:hypothetical protein
MASQGAPSLTPRARPGNVHAPSWMRLGSAVKVKTAANHEAVPNPELDSKEELSEEDAESSEEEASNDDDGEVMKSQELRAALASGGTSDGVAAASASPALAGAVAGGTLGAPAKSVAGVGAASAEDASHGSNGEAAVEIMQGKPWLK